MTSQASSRILGSISQESFIDCSIEKIEQDDINWPCLIMSCTDISMTNNRDSRTTLIRYEIPSILETEFDFLTFIK